MITKLYAVAVTFLLLTVLAASFPAFAAPESCMELFTECQTQKRVLENNYQIANYKDTLLGGHCLGYFEGFSNAISGMSLSLFCLPDNSTDGRQALIYVAWAERHPEKLHDPAGVCAAFALGEAFPCPPKK